jgi:hypothetical protein
LANPVTTPPNTPTTLEEKKTPLPNNPKETAS